MSVILADDLIPRKGVEKVDYDPSPQYCKEPISRSPDLLPKGSVVHIEREQHYNDCCQSEEEEYVAVEGFHESGVSDLQIASWRWRRRKKTIVRTMISKAA